MANLGAIAEGAFEGIMAGQQFKQSRAQTALTSAQSNKLLEDARRLREEEKRQDVFVPMSEILKGMGKNTARTVEREIRTRKRVEKVGGEEGLRTRDLEDLQLKITPEDIITVTTDFITDQKDKKAEVELRRAQDIKKAINDRQKMIDDKIISPDESEKDFIKRITESHPLTQDINAIDSSIGNARSDITTQEGIMREGKVISTPKSFVDTQGNFIGSFSPGTEPPGAIPLDVFKETKDSSMSTQRLRQLGTQAVSGTTITTKPPSITREKVLSATGPGAAMRQFVNNVFGFMFSGQFAPKTSKAKADIRSFNQAVKANLVVNPRAPVAELNIIQDFLIDPNKIFTDPDAEVSKLVGLRQRLEFERSSKLATIERGVLTDKQRDIFIDQINHIDIVLGNIPSVAGLQPNNATLDDIANVSDEEFKSFSKETQDILINKLQSSQQGTSGGF